MESKPPCCGFAVAGSSKSEACLHAARLLKSYSSYFTTPIYTGETPRAAYAPNVPSTPAVTADHAGCHSVGVIGNEAYARIQLCARAKQRTLPTVSLKYFL